ncbi:MAG: hypothetical protein O7A06_17070, partial [Acidobacteria bacterium]|nr:hypothetical protein [Acidobacteriota bacterium]
MMQSFLQLANRSKLFRQRLATLLLLLFVWDMGLHLAATPHPVHDAGVSIGALSEDGDAGIPDEHSDCKIPGHGCASSHHHHFPAFLSSLLITAPRASLKMAERVPAAATVQTALAARLIRA